MTKDQKIALLEAECTRLRSTIRELKGAMAEIVARSEQAAQDIELMRAALERMVESRKGGAGYSPPIG